MGLKSVPILSGLRRYVLCGSPAGAFMQTMLQLNPPIPLSTPKGEGIAVMVIDYGIDHDLWWTVIISRGEHAGEIWTYANPEVRGVENITLGEAPMQAKPINLYDSSATGAAAFENLAKELLISVLEPLVEAAANRCRVRRPVVPGRP